jgi:hypothetical protein
MAHILKGNAPELAALVAPVTQRKAVISCWNTPEALAASCETPHGWGNDDGVTLWSGGHDSWAGGSMAQAIQLCREGWQEGADKAAKLRDKINAANPVARRMVRFDVAGGVPNIPRALAGNPLNMKRIDMAKARRRPVITLASDVAVNCNVNQEVMQRRAACVTAIVDAIESAGFSCHVVAVARSVAHSGDTSALCVVTLKEASAQADMSRLAYGLGHPTMLRKLGFAAWCADKESKDLGTHLGSARGETITDEMKAAQVYMVKSARNADVERAFSSDESAVKVGLKLLLDDLTAQGCPAITEAALEAA